MTLTEHMEQMKVRLAACEDVGEALVLFEDCRQAEREIQQLSNIAADVAEKLTRQIVPRSWTPRLMERRMN